jgi:hypothetical protein
MKNALCLVVAAVVVLGAIPAFAGDGNVPQATLSALGLGNMQVVSDAEGMQVRGTSSSVQATSLSLFSAVLFDPFSGANFTFAGADFSRATDENAGLNATSSANVSSAAASAAFNTTIITGLNTWTATVSVINVSGLAAAVSP